MRFVISTHAAQEMERRGISLDMVERVLETPEQVVPGRFGKKVYQSQVDFGGGRIYLIRAIVDEESDPATLVTVYRTSKIAKYWRPI